MKPCARAWTSRLPIAVASTGPGDHRPATGVRRQLAQQTRCGCRHRRRGRRSTVLAGQPRRRPRRVRAKAAARLSRMQRTIAGRDRRHRLVGPRQAARRSAPACRPVRRNAGSSGSKIGPPAGQRRPPRPAARRGPAASPPTPHVAQRLLEQPEAHDVAQVADPAVDAELVGEVRRAARLGQDRRLELDADQRPRPAGDVREAGRRRPARRRTRTPCRATRRGSRASTAREPGRRRPPRASSGPSGVARRAIGGKIARGSPSSLDQVGGPRPRVPTSNSAGRRRVRRLGGDDPGQPVADEVGDHQQPVAPRAKAGSAALGRQLVDRVEAAGTARRSARTAAPAG